MSRPPVVIRWSSDPCAVFESISKLTWLRIVRGHDSGISFREESLTEHNLLATQLVLPHTRIHQFSGRDEARSGADWEWWLGRRGRWTRWRIQAKKARFPTGQLSRLRHETTHGRQLDLLISGAVSARAFPAYVFYAAWDTKPPAPSTACNRVPDPLKFDPTRFGCTLVSAYEVDRKLTASEPQKMRTFLTVGRPLDCLACCSCSSESNPAAGLADVSSAVGRQMLGDDVVNAFPDESANRSQFHEELPGYVESVIAGEPRPPRGRDVKGVMVISDDELAAR